MPKYVYPVATTNVSDDFNEHVARKSPNPGTDYTAGYGSVVVAPATGTVVGTTGNSGGGGRMIYLDFDNGDGVDLLHLSKVEVSNGQRVSQGQRVGLSGGSGYGDDWYYGPHLHISIRPHHGHHTTNYGNVDFDQIMRNQGADPIVIKPVRIPPMLTVFYSVRSGVGLFLVWVSSTRVSISDEISGMTPDLQNYWAGVALADAKAAGLPYTTVADIPTVDDTANGGWYIRSHMANAATGMPTDYPLSSSNPFNVQEYFGGGGGGSGPTADQIATAVDTKLAPRFAAIPDAVVDEFNDRLGGSRSLNFARDIALVLIGVAIVLFSLLSPDPTRLVSLGMGTGIATLGVVLLVAELRQRRNP